MGFPRPHGCGCLPRSFSSQRPRLLERGYVRRSDDASDPRYLPHFDIANGWTNIHGGHSSRINKCLTSIKRMRPFFYQMHSCRQSCRASHRGSICLGSGLLSSITSRAENRTTCPNPGPIDTAGANGVLWRKHRHWRRFARCHHEAFVRPVVAEPVHRLAHFTNVTAIGHATATVRMQHAPPAAERSTNELSLTPGVGPHMYGQHFRRNNTACSRRWRWTQPLCFPAKPSY